MFLSVVILGGFTTEAHAMAHLITIDRPGDYSHHQTDATRRGPTIFDVDYFWGNSPGIDPAIQVRVTYLRASPVGHPASRRRTDRRSAAGHRPLPPVSRHCPGTTTPPSGLAYPADRKPFLFRSGIWLRSDYGTTT